MIPCHPGRTGGRSVSRLGGVAIEWPIPKCLQDEIVSSEDGPIEVERFTAVAAKVMNLNNFFRLRLGIERPASPSKGLPSANSHVRVSKPIDSSIMPSLPPELSQWLAPSVVLAMLGLILGLQGKRIDELRADMKEGFAQARADMKEGFAQARADLRESEARQREDIAELKANNRALGEKLDRLVEALATVKQP